MNKYENIWYRRKHINEEIRIGLYHKAVKPVLTYNFSPWSNSTDEKKTNNCFSQEIFVM